MTLKLVNLSDNTVVVVLSSKVYPTCKYTTRQQRQCWMNLGLPAIALIQLLTKPNHNKPDQINLPETPSVRAIYVKHEKSIFNYCFTIKIRYI